MRFRLNNGIVLLIIQLVAFGPVWYWYVSRMMDGSDEPWGLVSLVAAVVLVLWRPTVQHGSQSLWVPSALMVLYAVTYPHVPPLVRAGLAVTALGCTISALRFRALFDAPTIGLLLLSLPVVSSLQFYLGFPLRIVSGALSIPLLQLGGLSVSLEGACLRWGSSLIAIDAPCSGVKMLWAGLFLTLIAASYHGLSPKRTSLAAFGATISVILANALRTSALFYMEAGIVPMPSWCHEGIGLSAFFGLALLTLLMVHKLAGGELCAGLSRTS